MSYFEQQKESLILFVRVTPHAKRAGIEGIWNKTHLKIALKAPAVDGKANEALVSFLANKFSVRKSDILIVNGQTSRLKKIKITRLSLDKITILSEIK